MHPPPRQPQDPAANESARLGEGDLLGNYRILRFIREGAAGSVYEAEHRVLRRRHALKVIHPRLMREGSFMSDFRYEARLLANLDHHNIVRVTDFGEDAGRCYYVMDYISGPDGAARTLQDELGRPGETLPLSEDRAVGIAVQIAEALEYAHQFEDNGLVHRDLKPSNILIKQRSDGVEQVLVADFGLAKVLGNDASLKTQYFEIGEAETVTQNDALVNASVTGTPPYMSPEQWVPGTRITPATDIYSFGVLLHQMLTGDLPYPDSRVLHDHPRTHTLHPPSEYGLDPRWDRIIRRCLEPLPRDRYPDVKSLLADLREVAGKDRLPPPPGRGRSLKRALVAVGAAAVTVAGVVWWVHHASSREGPVDVRVLVQPDRARLVLSRSGEVVRHEEALPAEGLTLRLEQGNYSYDVFKEGFQRRSGDFLVHPTNRLFKVQLPQLTGQVRVESAPGTELRMRGEGAAGVVLDTVDDNGELVIDLKVGRYELVLVHPDYLPATNLVEVSEDRPVRLVKQLQGLPATVEISSDPPGDVWYRDQWLGRTGETLGPWPPGEYRFRVRRPGYREEELAVKLAPNEKHVITAPPPRLLPGRLLVSVKLAKNEEWRVQPEAAFLRVDGGDWERVTLPLTYYLEDEVPRDLELRVPGYEVVFLQGMVVPEGDTVNEAVQLEPLRSRIRFTSTVPDATVYLDGKPVGGMGDIIEVEPYQYQEFVIRADGYAPRVIDWIGGDPDAEATEYRVELNSLPPVLIVDAELPPDFNEIPVVELFIDGVSRGRVTLPFETEKITEGLHEIFVADDRWRSMDPVEVFLEPGETETVSLPLRYATSWLVFDVQPVDAVVRVDGQVVKGKRFEVVPYSTYTVQISAPDHESVTFSHVALPGRDPVLKASLEPKTLLRLDTEPANATVQVNGRTVAGNRLELEGGVNHRIKVEAPGFKAWATEVTLERGEQRMLRVVLEKKRFGFLGIE